MQISIVKRATRPEVRIALQQDEARHVFGTNKPSEDERLLIGGNVISGILLTRTKSHDKKVTRGIKSLELTNRNKELTACTYIDPMRVGATGDHRSPIMVRGHLLPGGRLLTPPLLETWRGLTVDQFERTSPSHQQFINKLLQEIPEKVTQDLPGMEFLRKIEEEDRPRQHREEVSVVKGVPELVASVLGDIAEANASAPTPYPKVRAFTDEEPAEFAAVGKEGALGALLRAIQTANAMLPKLGSNMKLFIDEEGFLHLHRTYSPGVPVKVKRV